MLRILLIAALLFHLTCRVELFAQETDYSKYHREINQAEILISQENYNEALKSYQKVFSEFSFVFLRDCKIAAQLGAYQDQVDLTFEFLRRGVLSGWELKEIKKIELLKKMTKLPGWQAFEEQYPRLRTQYEEGLNSELAARVKKMFVKDQKKAMGALLRIGSKSQDKYAEQKFAPHSEQQMEELRRILLKTGYPGEKIIGNDYWVSTILSHHNSISEEYNKKDTLYPDLKPFLMEALSRGEVSPFELALIDEWYLSTSGQGKYVGYGILDPPTQSGLKGTNALRSKLFLRSVETRNGLIDIQDKTQMVFYLPGDGWIEGKIEVIPN